MARATFSIEEKESYVTGKGGPRQTYRRARCTYATRWTLVGLSAGRNEPHYAYAGVAGIEATLLLLMPANLSRNSRYTFPAYYAFGTLL